MLPSTTGARPGKINIIFSPNSDSSRLLPVRKPSPNPTSSSNDPTPQAIPNMVRKERNLCAHNVRKVCAKMSKTVRIANITLLYKPEFPFYLPTAPHYIPHEGIECTIFPFAAPFRCRLLSQLVADRQARSCKPLGQVRLAVENGNVFLIHQKT